MEFKDIRDVIRDYLQPKKKIIIAERTRFFEEKQMESELVTSYYARLKKASEFCEFDKLQGEDDVIFLKLVSGLKCDAIKRKVLEANQIKPINLAETIEFIQNMEQIRTFTNEKSKQALTTYDSKCEDLQYLDKNKMTEKKMLCSYCRSSHARGKYPAYGKTCNACRKMNHFAS